MPTFTKFIFVVLFILLFSSCAHYYYVPNEGNVLKLSEANDLKISISGNNDNENSDRYILKHLNLQAGYSPIKNLGLFASHFRISGEDNGVDIRKGNGHLTNFAIGGYHFIKTESLLDKVTDYDYGVSPGFLFDLYAGFGRGKIHHEYEQGGNADLFLRKYFLQGGIHWKGKVIGISCVYKIGKLNYFDGVFNFPIDASNTNSLIHIEEVRMFPFGEASFHGYVGIKHIRVYGDFTILHNRFEADFSEKNYLASLGIVLEIDEIFRKTKSQEK